MSDATVSITAISPHDGWVMPPDIMALLGDPPDWSKLAISWPKIQTDEGVPGLHAAAAQSGQIPQDFAKQMQDPKNLLASAR